MNFLIITVQDLKGPEPFFCSKIITFGIYIKPNFMNFVYDIVIVIITVIIITPLFNHLKLKFIKKYSNVENLIINWSLKHARKRNRQTFQIFILQSFYYLFVGAATIFIIEISDYSLPFMNNTNLTPLNGPSIYEDLIIWFTVLRIFYITCLLFLLIIVFYQINVRITAWNMIHDFENRLHFIRPVISDDEFYYFNHLWVSMKKVDDYQEIIKYLNDYETQMNMTSELKRKEMIEKLKH